MDVLRHKDAMLVRGYSHIVYVSPNLASNAATLNHEQRFLNTLRELAHPVPIDFLEAIPTVEFMLSYIQDESSKVLLMLDDFNELLFNSPDIADVYTRLSSHFGVDILATSHVGFSSGSKFYGNIFKNTNLIVIYPNLSDKSLVTYLSKKMFPGMPGFLPSCQQYVYEHLGCYAYLVIDTSIHKHLPRRFPVAARIFPFKKKDGRVEHMPLYFRWKPNK